MLKIYFKDGFVEEFPEAFCYVENVSTGMTLLWKKAPQHPGLTQHPDIIDSFISNEVDRVEYVR